MLYVSIVSCSRAREITFICPVVDAQNDHPQKMGYRLKVHSKMHIPMLLYKIKFEYLNLLQNRSCFFLRNKTEKLTYNIVL